MRRRKRRRRRRSRRRRRYNNPEMREKPVTLQNTNAKEPAASSFLPK